MKTLSKILIIIIAAQLYACKKDNTNPSPDKQLTGKWLLIRTRVGTGGPGVWVNDDKKDVVQFNFDGSLGGSVFPGYNKYSVKGDTTLVIINSADASRNTNFYNKTTTDSLTMNINGATEGDTMQFARTK